jgi:protein-L-isoaspartate(D-aspartate) O-methyltransferase
MVTAAGPRIPAPLVEQVREGGRIVMPVGDRYSQALVAASKAGDRMEEVSVCRCVFVPLIGESGWEG